MIYLERKNWSKRTNRYDRPTVFSERPTDIEMEQQTNAMVGHGIHREITLQERLQKKDPET